ncbi:hypothetical protein I3842_15G049200 [Carya illinoinensis]|uniref:Uncharacterized protein n=1 Tax=Carya illinoinensis TaxID=32201 RepID=A0A922D635_CARIL|nr:hypothetical protein I3842_15G049200 [Carya illinoinensis]
MAVLSVSIVVVIVAASLLCAWKLCFSDGNVKVPFNSQKCKRYSLQVYIE